MLGTFTPLKTALITVLMIDNKEGVCFPSETGPLNNVKPTLQVYLNWNNER